MNHLIEAKLLEFEKIKNGTCSKEEDEKEKNYYKDCFIVVFHKLSFQKSYFHFLSLILFH